MERKFLNRDRSNIYVEGKLRLIIDAYTYCVQSFDSIEFNPFSFFFFTRTARSKFIIYTYTLLAASIFLELSSEELASRDDHARRRRRRGRTARRNIALRKGYVYFATVFLFARVPAKFRPIDTDLYGSISRLFLSLLEHVPSLGFDRADPLLPWDLLLQRNSLCVYIYIYTYTVERQTRGAVDCARTTLKLGKIL